MTKQILNQTTFEVARLQNISRNPILVIGDYINEEESFIALQGILYCWNESIYVGNLKHKLNGIIQRICAGFTQRYSSNLGKEIYKYLCDSNQVSEWDINSNPQYIPFQNGWYDIDSCELITPNENIYYTYQYDWDYEETADCSRFKQFMIEILPNEVHRKKILTYLAYCFTNRVDMQKALIIYGKGSNGKSVLMDIMNYIFKDNASHVMLQNIGDRFNKIRYMGKLVNIADDLPHTSLKEDGFFKMLVTNEVLEGEMKGKDPIDYKNSCKVICTCNQIPTPDYQCSEGFYRRWIIIPFLQKFTVNPLMLTLKEEILGIINYIISFVGEIDSLRPYDLKKNKKLWYRYGASTLQFYERCEKDEITTISCGELYNDYHTYCKNNDLPNVNRIIFGKELSKLGIDKKQVKICVELPPQWCYIGIFFDEED